MSEVSVESLPAANAGERGTARMQWQGWIMAVLLIAGILIRICLYFHARPFWSDEAALALNIIDKSFLQQLGPLDAATEFHHAPYAGSPDTNLGGYPWNQVCPIGFIWLVKLCTLVAGLTARSLRFVSLISSCAALGLAALWLRNSPGSRFQALYCMALLSFADTLIEYSTELKPYGFELLIALCLLNGFYPRARPPAFSRARCVCWAFAGALFIWCSYSCAFFLCGTFLPLLYVALRKRDWRELAWMSLPPALWLLSFALELHTVLRFGTTNKSLHDSLIGCFAPLPPRSLDDIVWYWEALLLPVQYVLGFDVRCTAFGAALCLVGIFSSWRRDPLLTSSLLGPILVTLAASALHAFPWTGRVLIFLAFSIAWFLGEGAALLGEMLWAARPRAIAWCIPSILAFNLLLSGDRPFRHFAPGDPYRKNLCVDKVMDAIHSDSAPYDAIFIYQPSASVFNFYSKLRGYHWKTLWVGHVEIDETPESVARVAAEIRQVSGNHRVWIILGDNHWLGLREAYLASLLGNGGKQIERFSASGSIGLLYDFGAKAGTHA